MKTAELTGAMLDYWVARAEGYEWSADIAPERARGVEPYSTDWAQGGPIIEREVIKLQPVIPAGKTWYASITKGPTIAEFQSYRAQADAPLVAAMRAYVASKFGEEVPEAVPHDTLKGEKEHG